MGKGVAAAIYREGEETGKAYFRTIQAVLPDPFEGAGPREAFETCLDFFRLIGYGRFSVVRWDDEVRVRLTDRFAAEASGPSGRKSCTSLAGLLASLLHEVHQAEGKAPEFVCEETRCASSGAESCEFVASRE